MLFVIEDAHWIDATTLEAVSRSISLIKTAPVCLLITFRPEFMPPWLDQSHVTMLRLNRLPREQVGAMVMDVTNGKELPPEVYDEIIRKTDGVPLFVEELANCAYWNRDSCTTPATDTSPSHRYRHLRFRRPCTIH